MNTTKTVVRQAVKFADGAVRTVRFVAGPKRVVITCRGLPRIVIRATEGGFVALSANRAVRLNAGIHKAPVKAYKEGIALAWGQ